MFGKKAATNSEIDQTISVQTIPPSTNLKGNKMASGRLMLLIMTDHLL